MRTVKFWTEDEDKLLIEKYPVSTNSEIMQFFPYRTYTSIYKRARKLGLYKNNDASFRQRSKPGDKSHAWKGGIKRNKAGYVLEMCKGHARADSNGYVLQHILIMEKHIQRPIKESEVVHHKNKVKYDNRIENLELMDKKEHNLHHHLGSKRSDNTKRKISINAKKRLKNKINHPNYKNVNIDEILKMKSEGLTNKEIGCRLGINRDTVRNKINEFKNKESVRYE